MCPKYTDKDTRLNSVCFTGHRDIAPKDAYYIPQMLKAVIKEAIERGACRFFTGGAMGFDTIAALCVLELKEQYPHIKLELILPCRNQSQKWNELGKSVYESILERADRVEYLHDTYTAGCMHDRNRRLIDLCDLVVAYCQHSGGGTAYTMAYALKQERELVNLCDLTK